MHKTTKKVVLFIAGIILLIGGADPLISYFQGQQAENSDLAKGIVITLLGLVLLLKDLASRRSISKKDS